MTEQTERARRPKTFLLRKLVIAAAVMALAFALAIGANAATGGELYNATVGRLLGCVVLDNGGVILVTEEDTVDGTAFVATLEGDPVDIGDGKVVINIDENPEPGDGLQVHVEKGTGLQVHVENGTWVPGSEAAASSGISE